VYVVKELLDNAVAAIEEFGVTPMIRVTLTDSYIEVAENGPGISDAVLDNILDFDRFGGSNRHHKLPTRGAQGNAIMTIMGIVSAWLDVGYIELYRPSGHSLRLQVNLDKVKQKVDVIRIPFGAPKPSAIRVPLPELPWKRGGSTLDDVFDAVRQFAWMNPHAKFMVMYKSTIWSTPPMNTTKTKPCMNEAHKAGASTWFTLDEFTERMAADVRARPNYKLYDWMREFAFSRISPSDLRNQGIDNVPIENAVKQVKSVYEYMSKVTSKKATFPQFNAVGDERLAQFLTKEMGTDADAGHWYHSVSGTFSSNEAEIPFLVEVCLMQMPEGKRRAPEPILAMNRTFLYGSPSFKGKDGFKYRDKVRGQWLSINGDLGSIARAYQIDHGKTPCSFVVHVTCPSPGYSGYGKQQFDTSWLSAPLSECLEKATLEVRRQRHGETKRKKAKKQKRDTIRLELFRLIPRVLKEVTDNGKYEPLIRQFYYSMRKEWYVLDDRELHYGTFCAYIDEYERNVAGKAICLKDPRGTMYEPHNGKTVRLGTADVRDFKPKKWLGHTIIFVEKENLAAQMRQMKIDKRWDAIIVGSKGFAVEAIRDVLQKYKKLLGDMVKIICLHDADPAGYMIGYDLATNLPRFGENVKIEVIDVGLTIRDAVEMGLQDEPFEIKKHNWSMINKTMTKHKIVDPDGTKRPLMEPEAFDAFMPKMFRTGEFPYWVDKPKGRRVELNAMPPKEFEQWVEKNLEKHGCKKVRPPDAIVEEKMKTARRNKVTTEMGAVFMKLAGEDMVMEVMREIGVPAYDLDKVLEGRPETHWEYLVTRAAQGGEDINEAVTRVMKRRVPLLFQEQS
jgi:hypothetical protein